METAETPTYIVAVFQAMAGNVARLPKVLTKKPSR